MSACFNKFVDTIQTAAKGFVIMKANELLKDATIVTMPAMDENLQQEMERIASQIVTSFWFQPSTSDLPGVMEAETSTNNPTFTVMEPAVCEASLIPSIIHGDCSLHLPYILSR